MVAAPTTALRIGSATRRQARGRRSATTGWVFPQAGTYGNKTDYFLTNADQAQWGPQLERLQTIKWRVDPSNLIRMHKGIGNLKA